MKNFSKRFNLFACLLLFQISFFSSSYAQNSKSFLVRPWAVGQSATYETQNFQDGQLTSTEIIIYSIVGLEVIDGKNYLWLEIEKNRPDGPTIIRKLEIRQPQAIDFENVLTMDLANGIVGNNLISSRRRIEKIEIPGNIKRSSTHEFEISPEAVSQVENGPNPSAIRDLSSQFKVAPDQTTQVQAGSFKTTEFRRSGKENLGTSHLPVLNLDAFGNPEVPIWGVVHESIQSKGKEENSAQKTELISFTNTGATSKVKDKPRFMSLKEQDEIGKRFFSKPFQRENGQ